MKNVWDACCSIYGYIQKRWLIESQR
jgi:hypothetical protein